MREHEINKLDNFIGGWYLDDPIIDKLISYHKESPYKRQGVVNGFSDDSCFVNKDLKDSVDVNLSCNLQLYDEYVSEYLQRSVEKYVEKYPFCDNQAPWNPAIEAPNIQYYPPGGGYFVWHCERGTSFSPTNNRHLVYMTYLNDVREGGETEFYHQKVKIKPERGLTIIWPSDWTFTHRGIASPTEKKYIITGWYHYVPRT